MAEESRGLSNVSKIHERQSASGGNTSRFGGSGGHGGGGGGGGMTEIPIKDYVDAQDEKTRAQNDARFAEVITRLDNLNPATWWQNAVSFGVAILAGIGIVFAVLAYASDRFDSGVSAMGAIEERLDVQREINEAQNARIDRLLGALEANNDQSQESPTGQD